MRYSVSHNSVFTPNKAGSPPKYSHLKSRDLAKVQLGRQVIYLGKFKSPESFAKYAQALELHREGRSPTDIKAILAGKLIANGTTGQKWVLPVALTVGQLSHRYWTEHAEEYYKSSIGLSAGRVANCRLAIRAVNDLYSRQTAESFTPVMFLEVRASLVDRGLLRIYAQVEGSEVASNQILRG